MTAQPVLISACNIQTSSIEATAASRLLDPSSRQTQFQIDWSPWKPHLGLGFTRTNPKLRQSRRKKIEANPNGNAVSCTDLCSQTPHHHHQLEFRPQISGVNWGEKPPRAEPSPTKDATEAATEAVGILPLLRCPLPRPVRENSLLSLLLLLHPWREKKGRRSNGLRFLGGRTKWRARGA